MVPAPGVAVRVGGGDEVPVDLVQVVGVGGVVGHQLVDDVSGHSGRDPLSGVNTSLQPNIGSAGPSLKERILKEIVFNKCR